MENTPDNTTPNPLTKEQVDAVRFQVAKPGYAFPQVEAFIEKVKSTLTFLEKEMAKDKIALAEAQDEIELLSERSETLNATLEIFRVKGDALVNADGEYVTESQTNNTQKLIEENNYLKEQLRIAQEDANAGWEAEAELRKYIEVQLLPWLEKNKNTIVANLDNDKEEAKIEEKQEPLLGSEEDNTPDSEFLLEEEEPETVVEIDEIEEEAPIESSSEASHEVAGGEEDTWLEEAEGDEEADLDDISNITFEEVLEHPEHITVSLNNEPLIGSEDESDWFK